MPIKLIYTIRVIVPADDLERLQYIFEELKDDVAFEVLNVETVKVAP